MIKPAPVIRDQHGQFCHPDWPHERLTTRGASEEWLLENNGNYDACRMPDGCDFLTWEPEKPSPDAFILTLYITDDGPAVLWFVPKLLH